MSIDSAPLDILIVGAGISGIGMAAHLQRNLPGKRMAILDRRENLGGTWDLFRYPGVRSDSDMYTLGFAFAPWSGERSVARGEEILSYLGQVAARYDLDRHMHFSHEVTHADWDSSQSFWRVTAKTAKGSAEFLTRFLFLGSGYYDYDVPHDPQIAGLNDFAGPVLHPQFWPQDFDPAGRRIAVIGSGATAVTLVPALADAGARVTMVQRTPSWFLAQPARDLFATSAAKVLPRRWAYSLTRLRNNALQYWFFNKSRREPEQMGAWLKQRIRDQLGEHYDEKAFTPPYGPWVQRMCFVPDGDFFKAIREGRAALATGAIGRVTADAIELESGERVDADAIVTATGLRLATLGKIAISLDGSPVNFGEHWYYRNCMFSNVPNLAAVFGYLNAAWTGRVDMVSEWLCRLLGQMDAWGADTAVPFLPPDHDLEADDPLAGYSSGYLQRGRHLIPKSASRSPWRLSHDLMRDRREFRELPIDDGHLRFSRGGRQL
ncbi:Predicted flavoprotein CzcO associated with the cation diffusion facilitator CzcD [Novosphingobium mathurense]|uniref:Predicted flavoprotein CzcO associated with the cation diffusion facilitator CzcD n=2 Tax=Novosphingobium mathurense TaxID=428990 RepID=A0A1U6GSH0_9SPHN|nr:Predicted flavoprotein CzcO associated with the cation diffusion facilitator CzcD [Novosphingobium mathurense]